LRALLLAGAASLMLSACANNRTAATSSGPVLDTPDYTAMSRAEAQDTLMQLADAYKRRPRDKVVIIQYATALRAAGQAEQAASVLEGGVAALPKDQDIRLAY